MLVIIPGYTGCQDNFNLARPISYRALLLYERGRDRETSEICRGPIKGILILLSGRANSTRSDTTPYNTVYVHWSAETSFLRPDRESP